MSNVRAQESVVNEEEASVLLRSIADRQASIDQRLSAIEATHQEACKKYEASDAAYRTELSNYRQENSNLASSRTVAMVVRFAVLLLLVYVAYRVS